MIRETFAVGPLRCNCTVLGDETTREGAVIDPGGDVATILQALSRHSLTLKMIVVTHAHLDHIAGAESLKQITGAPVLYHQSDLPLVALMDQQAKWMGVATPPVAPPDESIEDGRTLRLGETPVQILHTPGHTPGSVALYVPSADLLIAGDTLFRNGVGRTDLWLGDSQQLLRSIQDRLLHLPECTHVVAGHGHNTTIANEKINHITRLQ